MSLTFVSGSISLVLACKSGLYLFVLVIRSTGFFLNPFPLRMTHFKRSALILRFWTAHKRSMRIKASASLKAHRITEAMRFRWASHRISHMRAHMRAFNNTGRKFCSSCNINFHFTVCSDNLRDVIFRNLKLD